MKIRRSAICLTLSLVLFLAGCSSYQPVRPSESRTIALAPIMNESDVPQIIAPLSRNLREALNHSAGWRIVDEDDADVVLTVTVLNLDRNTISRDPEDTGRPLSYYEELVVSVLWESDLPPPWGVQPISIVSANTVLYAQPSLATGESAAIGELANEIATKIVSRISWPSSDRQ